MRLTQDKTYFVMSKFVCFAVGLPNLATMGLFLAIFFDYFLAQRLSEIG